MRALFDSQGLLSRADAYLAVRGPDRIGFLGSLVRSLASHSLVPREMTISTCSGVAYDRFLPWTGRCAIGGPRGARRRPLRSDPDYS